MGEHDHHEACKCLLILSEDRTFPGRNEDGSQSHNPYSSKTHHLDFVFLHIFHNNVDHL